MTLKIKAQTFKIKSQNNRYVILFRDFKFKVKVIFGVRGRCGARPFPKDYGLFQGIAHFSEGSHPFPRDCNASEKGAIPRKGAQSDGEGRSPLSKRA